jgi:hypothetical protein
MPAFARRHHAFERTQAIVIGQVIESDPCGVEDEGIRDLGIPQRAA